MYRYGGIFERGSKEYTLDDFYALQLDKMDRYLCLKKSDVVIPTEGEEESSSDEDDGEDDEDDEDDDGDREASGDDGPDTPKQEPAEVEVVEAVEAEVEAKEDDVSDPSNCIERGADSRDRTYVLKPRSSWAFRKTPLDPQKT